MNYQSALEANERAAADGLPPLFSQSQLDFIQSGAPSQIFTSQAMNSDEFSDNYWFTPAVDSSTVPLGGGSLGQSYIAPMSDYGQAADPTGPLNLAAQTVTTNALAGGSLIAASGDTQPIDNGQTGMTDWNQSLALALGDTVRQVVASAGQVATNAVNAAGQKVVAKVNPSQKTSVANTPKPAGMMMTPTTMLVLAAVVVGVIVLANKSHRSA